MPPSPPIMDRETILPEMTDMREPASVAYTAVGEMTFCRPPHDARKTSAELGKEEEAMPITGPHDKPN